MKKIPREEWDFSSCVDSELEACFFYEYNRHASEECVNSILHARKACDAQDFDFLVRNMGYAGEPRGWPRWNLFPYCPEWPEKPFLSIPFTERKRRLAALKKRWPDAKALHQFDFNYVRKKWGKLSVVDYENATIAALEIDWDLTDKELSERFSAWLRESRQGRAPKFTNGAASDVRQLKKALESLSIWRFSQHYEGSWAKIECNNSELVEALGRQYENQSAWSRAKRHAESLFSGEEDLTDNKSA